MRVVPIVVLSSVVSIVAAAGLACGSTSSSSQASTGGDGGGAEASSPAGDGGGGGGKDGGSTPAPYPAVVPTDVPQVANAGGPVLASPKIYPVIFANDDATEVSQIEDFVSKVGATNYWKTAVKEYGVGPATGEAPIVLTAADNPPATWDDTQIQAWLLSKLNGNDPAWGTPDQNTLYALFYPASTTITIGGGGGGGGGDAGAPDAGGAGGAGGGEASCQAFGGYHSDLQLDANHNSMTVAYAVIPRCSNFPGQTTMQATTGSASHEFVEAATDPYPDYNPAYSTADNDHHYWARTLGGGGEVGDMCAQEQSSFVQFPELAYQVQRIWSNAAVKAGSDPCIPSPQGDVYVNAIPETSDEFTVTSRGQTYTYKGVSIPVGQSKTVVLDLVSSAPTSAPFTVEVIDSNQLFNPSATPVLKFALDKTQGVNGDKINLTITVASSPRGNNEAFLIVSKNGTQDHFWIGVVGTGGSGADGGSSPADAGGKD